MGSQVLAGMDNPLYPFPPFRPATSATARQIGGEIEVGPATKPQQSHNMGELIVGKWMVDSQTAKERKARLGKIVTRLARAPVGAREGACAPQNATWGELIVGKWTPKAFGVD